MQRIDTKELQRMQQAGRTPVINVLSKDQFQQKHIPESKNVPLKDPKFSQRVEEIAGSKDEPVVVYCGSQDCNASEDAARKLEAEGFKKVFDYEGGMKAWEEASLPVRGIA